MLQLSYWAKLHPVSARILIVISRCCLFVIAWFLGQQLIAAGIELSQLCIYLLILIFFTACAAYPGFRSVKNYVWRKTCDGVVATSGFLMVICFSAQLNTPIHVYEPAGATVPVTPPGYRYPEAQKLLEQFKSGEKTKFSAKEKRIIKEEFKFQLIRYGKAKITGNKKEGSDAVYIILACIAAAGLLMLVLSIACGLSCNGSDAAAVVVGVLGTAAVIWGLIAVINRIKRGPPAVKKEQPTPS